MAKPLPHIAPMQICYDPAMDLLEIWLGNGRDARDFHHEEGLIKKTLRTPKTIGVRIEDYENNFRSLPDISWLKGKGLPHYLLDWILCRPCLRASSKTELQASLK